MHELASWLQSTQDEILELYRRGKLPHALILDAKEGWGATELAQSIVIQLLGQPLEDSDESVAHPDLRWVSPGNPERARPSQVIQIDEIRQVTDFLETTPVVGDIKIAVICQAERMNEKAANAFLKILEEPPQNRYIFLVTNYVSQLLPTLRSRSRRVQLRKPDADEVGAWLRSRLPDTKDELINDHLIEHDYAPYAIEAAIQQGDLILRKELAQVVREPYQASDLARELSRANVDDILVRWQRSVHRMAQRNTNSREIHQYFERLCNMRRQFAEVVGLNWQVQFESLLLDFYKLYRNVHRNNSIGGAS